MKQTLRAYLSLVDGDYADIRYERMERTRIELRGKELTEIGSNVTDGYVVRLLKSGGFATASVTRASDLESAMKRATLNALAMAGDGENKVGLTLPPCVEHESLPKLDEDPRAVFPEEKLALLKNYNSLVTGFRDIITTSAVYEETIRYRYFVNSMGTWVHEPLITSSISIRMVAGRDGIFQNGRAVVGSSDGFLKIRNRDEVFQKKAETVTRLLDAEPVPSGRYNVVLNPEMAGVFIHEAFGHFSEADLIEHNPSLREKMKIGARLGSGCLTIVDDPAMEGQIGFYRFDDEGVEGRRVVLMDQGILSGRLHSMRTAFAYGESLTGHAVAEDSRYAPIVRMGCIFACPGESGVDELISKAGDGLYVLDSKGGQTSGESFTFGAQYGYLIRNGKPGPMVRDMNLMGNLFSTLLDVEGVSSELVISETGGCGKGQMNIRSAMGGPHMLIRNVKVGGV
ncbi:MAG: TldD/PmbA family protein [Desulfobacteraceae bacterium]|jgi:TldD protein|nr:MAG: TldD/PmbA family protein [Desulfobacteraceae bacterium]